MRYIAIVVVCGVLLATYVVAYFRGYRAGKEFEKVLKLAKLRED